MERDERVWLYLTLALAKCDGTKVRIKVNRELARRLSVDRDAIVSVALEALKTRGIYVSKHGLFAANVADGHETVVIITPYPRLMPLVAGYREARERGWPPSLAILARSGNIDEFVKLVRRGYLPSVALSLLLRQRRSEHDCQTSVQGDLTDLILALLERELSPCEWLQFRAVGLDMLGGVSWEALPQELRSALSLALKSALWRGLSITDLNVVSGNSRLARVVMRLDETRRKATLEATCGAKVVPNSQESRWQVRR